MNSKHITTDESRNFYNNLADLTDREIQEKQLFYQFRIMKDTEKIKNNVQFWFYASIATVILTILIFSIK